MNRSATLLLLAATRCGPVLEFAPETPCQRAQGLERGGTWDFFGDTFPQGARLTASSDGAGETWHATTRMYGGRVFLTLYPPVVSGTLPRPVTTTAGCALNDRVEFRDDADGKLYPATATLVVHDGGQPGTVTLDFTLTGLTFESPTRGTVKIDDESKVLP